MNIFPSSQLPATIAQTQTAAPQSDLSTASKTMASKPIESLPSSPRISEIAKVSAQNLVVAQSNTQSIPPEQARALSEREKMYMSITNLNAQNQNGEKLDLRMPLIDGSPDRPLPGELDKTP